MHKTTQKKLPKYGRWGHIEREEFIMLLFWMILIDAILLPIIYAIGIPALILIPIIGGIIFISAPIYLLLNLIDRVKNGIKEKIREKWMYTVFEMYKKDEEKEYRRLYGQQ